MGHGSWNCGSKCKCLLSAVSPAYLTTLTLLICVKIWFIRKCPVVKWSRKYYFPNVWSEKVIFVFPWICQWQRLHQLRKMLPFRKNKRENFENNVVFYKEHKISRNKQNLGERVFFRCKQNLRFKVICFIDFYGHFSLQKNKLFFPAIT